MKIIKEITVQNNIDISEKKLRTYWEDRDMKFVKSSENYLKGKRGNLLGNLSSFNMKKIISEIEITNDLQKIKCEL